MNNAEEKVTSQVPQQEQEQDINELMQVRRNKLADLKENGKNPFEITKFDVTYTSDEIIARYDEIGEPEHDPETGLPTSDREPVVVSIAGRMMLKRIMGKASFAHIQDKKGLIQIYVRRDDLGTDAYSDFKTMDIGDIIGITGTAFKTKTGEITVKAQSLRP